MSKNKIKWFIGIGAVFVIALIIKVPEESSTIEKNATSKIVKPETIVDPKPGEDGYHYQYRIEIKRPAGNLSLSFDGRWKFVEETRRLYIIDAKDTVGDFLIPEGGVFDIWEQD